MHLAPVRMSVALAMVVAAGAACTSANLMKRELVVYFAATATQQAHRSALAACTGVAPHTTPEPMVSGGRPANRVGDVRFRIDRADDHDLSVLLACLHRQPGVIGYTIPD